MTISNFGAAGVRPGVCTSTTRPTTPYNGQVIYETDTGRALVWDGTAWEYLATGTPNPVGIELIKTQTIGTSVSTVVVSDVFSATYDNYRIFVQGGSTSTSAYLTLQLGATTSNYRFDYIYGNLAGTVGSVGSVGASNFAYLGFAGISNMADISLVGPNKTAATMCMAAAGRTGNNMGTFVGVQIDSTSFTGFTLGCTGGTMTGGTIRVYGYKN